MSLDLNSSTYHHPIGTRFAALYSQCPYLQGGVPNSISSEISLGPFSHGQAHMTMRLFSRWCTCQTCIVLYCITLF